MSRFKVAGLGLVLLAGCDSDPQLQALNAELQAIRQQAVPLADETPATLAGLRFVSSPTPLRDPFQPPDQPASRPTGKPGPAPDLDRPRQFLEGFAVDQFQMVGTLSLGAQTFALLRGASGVHRLAVGDYLGADHGRVVRIHEGQLELVELFPDGEGAWLERPRTLVLNVNS
ncbi:pilus assembly protein PilP [Pseudomonas sp. WS 5059]|jgi:type IV pilus assembly protein PilO/type IV pilus assembly protein PilP|uniref:pilus assembly protein PilP n=1 Tax=unclassified Pseudomonas TaxID=196821 RepID=UPI001475A869|nr:MULTISPECIES: pilus assembly protein PilP [unclassified Pseudomonas]NMX66593.1 pilus assembly protein PilP [Pseudomonas sp. WS 5111]NMX88139.1 pilus assembly protein PilP [Pseudomonas sp. WS 5010]NMY04029.1 pilus assembly protein PilP [Pseudomonas sp. WS 5059]